MQDILEIRSENCLIVIFIYLAWPRFAQQASTASIVIMSYRPIRMRQQLISVQYSRVVLVYIAFIIDSCQYGRVSRMTHWQVASNSFGIVYCIRVTCDQILFLSFFIFFINTSNLFSWYGFYAFSLFFLLIRCKIGEVLVGLTYVRCWL